VVWRRKIPTTNPLRTLIDLGAVAPDAVKPTFERMIVERLVSPSAVVALLLRHQGPGRHGVTALRAVLEDWTMNELPPDSVLEEAMNDLVLRHRLPPVTFHPVVCGYEPDFIVTGSRILIECDGWATHGLDRRTFEKDRERDADLLAEGYVVIHVTWRQIKFHPGAVARRVRAVIERVAPELLTTRR
jgi:very-short-patch-repair endonuclease